MCVQKGTVSVYLPTSFHQPHHATLRSATREVKSVDALFNESEVVVLAPPTEADVGVLVMFFRCFSPLIFCWLTLDFTFL